ncbi:hypothetical protein X801_03261 [Opisthorchis viverrini]|uniref:TRPM SLOG domain-containing protein n=1 Tax=Opisthorchis viverrini TaxID=6198 RepID=A0A1S8X2B1_OPIVI|nr:hypothetical protein X801_03261 [Opisthorchis viverrini]
MSKETDFKCSSPAVDMFAGIKPTATIRGIPSLQLVDSLWYVRIAHSDKVEDVMSLMGIHWRFKHPRIVRNGNEGDGMHAENLVFEDCRKELLKTIPKGSKLRRIPDTAWQVELDKNPRLCIAVLGGEENFVLEESKSETFKKVRGLINAAETTDGWIITTGLNKGVVRILSEALEDHHTRCLDPQSNRLRCLGIVLWRSVRNRLILESNDVKVTDLQNHDLHPIEI